MWGLYTPLGLASTEPVREISRDLVSGGVRKAFPCFVSAFGVTCAESWTNFQRAVKPIRETLSPDANNKGDVKIRLPLLFNGCMSPFGKACRRRCNFTVRTFFDRPIGR